MKRIILFLLLVSAFGASAATTLYQGPFVVGSGLSISGDTLSATGAAGWGTSGNSGLTSANFIGTTDLADLIFKANNGNHGQIGTNGDVFFGTNNVATGTDTFTGGGQSNTNNAILGVIGGGHKNMIKGTGASGGKYNTIGGGQFNIIWSGLNWATICGGQQNTISTNGVNVSDNSFIGGGFSSLIESSAKTSIVGGGWNAATNANNGFIGGGTGNQLITGFNSVIPGGLSNSVSGNYSFAAGAFATATHANSFLWADSQGTYNSLANDSFGIRAQGGMFLHSGGLAVGGTTAQTAGNITATNIITGKSFVVTTVSISSGSGSPESAVTAPVGSLFLRTDGSTSTTLYVKTSGSGNTGWTAK